MGCMGSDRTLSINRMPGPETSEGEVARQIDLECWGLLEVSCGRLHSSNGSRDFGVVVSSTVKSLKHGLYADAR